MNNEEINDQIESALNSSSNSTINASAWMQSMAAAHPHGLSYNSFTKSSGEYIDPLFKLGEEVYHITPDSPKGYVVDIQYSFLSKIITYVVTFGPGNEQHLIDAELSRTRNYS